MNWNISLLRLFYGKRNAYLEFKNFQMGDKVNGVADIRSTVKNKF